MKIQILYSVKTFISPVETRYQIHINYNAIEGKVITYSLIWKLYRRESRDALFAIRTLGKCSSHGTWWDKRDSLNNKGSFHMRHCEHICYERKKLTLLANWCVSSVERHGDRIVRTIMESGLDFLEIVESRGHRQPLRISGSTLSGW